jgi:N-acetylneuraminic acid mutarotase
MFQQERVPLQNPFSWRIGKLASLLSLLLLLAGVSPRLSAQVNAWTWMGGSNSINQPGVYGTKGMPAAGNVPGARSNAVSWTDASGDFWLFGGYGYDVHGDLNDLNDLWKYTPSTGEWTWMSGSNSIVPLAVYGTKGVPAAGNVPGGRFFAVGWTDSSGNLWLFGGEGEAGAVGRGGDLNDLWKYTPSTGDWTWMSGSDSGNQPSVYGTKGVSAAGNVPGARDIPVAWTDASGNLWLFGGFTDCCNYWNDLWRYAPSTGEWTWMGGSNSAMQPGVYGTKGVPAPGNVPSAREDATSRTDASGNFWLFGGVGEDASYNFDFWSDLWMYTPSTGEWTWMSGTNLANQPGVYGTLGVPAAGNVPGGRAGPVSWTDSSGNLWFFGGGYRDSMNDLWKYALSTGEWTWMSGSNGANQPGVYGTKGVPAAGNVPGARGDAVSWTDSSGNLWLFGGGGYDANGLLGSLNDLWKYGPTPVLPFSLISSLNPAPSGEDVALTAEISPAPVRGTDLSFWEHDTLLGTARFTDGIASLSISLPPGLHPIAAAYIGASGKHISPLLVQQVLFPPETITLTSLLNPAAAEQKVTFTATMAPAWPGKVYFYDVNTLLGTATLSGGTASLSTSALALGVHRVVAVFEIYGTLTDSPLLLENISAAGTPFLSSSLNPAAPGQTVTFTATVVGESDTGAVSFYADNALLGTVALSGGTASVSTSALSSGPHQITARYTVGGSTHDSAVLVQGVLFPNTTATLTSSLNPAAQGKTVTFTATVAPSWETGTVQFWVGTTMIGTAALSGGAAPFSTSTLALGQHNVRALFRGPYANLGEEADSNVLVETITAASTTALNPAGKPVE